MQASSNGGSLGLAAKKAENVTTSLEGEIAAGLLAENEETEVGVTQVSEPSNMAASTMHASILIIRCLPIKPESGLTARVWKRLFRQLKI